MTLTRLESSKLPPLSVFLETVCPGTPFLDENIHFTLQDSLTKETLKQVDDLSWPLTDSMSASSSVRAHLDRTYLNVARPPFVHDVRRNIESTTYVPLPLHVVDVFDQASSVHETSKNAGGVHIGANVNPLMQDPFKLVHLNPGCLSSILVLSNSSRTRNLTAADSRNPFNKVTTSINKLLRMGGANGSDLTSYFTLIIEAIPEPAPPHHISHPLGPLIVPLRRNSKTNSPFCKLLLFDEKSYFSQVRLPATAKLLISTNINVLNVFALDEGDNYVGTESTLSTKAIFPLAEGQTESSSASHSSASQSSASQSSASQPATAATTTTTCKPYTRVTEKPILRFQFRSHIIVTSMITILSESLVVLGLNTGDIIVINLVDLTYRQFDNLGLGDRVDPEGSSSKEAVTSILAIWHPSYSLLLSVGYGNGEVILLDPAGSPSSPSHRYEKQTVGKDALVTYFKKFDLSSLNMRDSGNSNDLSPDYIVGHFKISHKAITCFASTMGRELSVSSAHRPLLLAVASDDGLVRFIDLISTHGKNYGDTTNFYNQLIVSDIVSSYFQDGIRSIEFSPDFRYFCMAGKGDLIEVFRMKYYNINGLLMKNTESSHRGGRSRSGTVNSNNSGNATTPSLFLSPTSTTPATSLDVGRDEHHDTHYPPTIKDITIVSRLKGHTNTVDLVFFVREDDLVSSSISNATSRTYKLMSFGEDGKVIIWDFDSKALPRVKKSHITTKRRVSVNPELTQAPLPVNPRGKAGLVPSISKSHHRNRSLSYQTEEMTISNSFSALGINTLLSQSPQPLQLDNTEEQLKIVFSLYRSLFEIRLKKHYAQAQNKDLKRKYNAVIHAVVNDKILPSIEIPLLSIDFSCLIRDQKIQGVHVNSEKFWIFGHSGDILTYSLTH